MTVALSIYPFSVIIFCYVFSEALMLVHRQLRLCLLDKLNLIIMKYLFILLLILLILKSTLSKIKIVTPALLLFVFSYYIYSHF